MPPVFGRSPDRRSSGIVEAGGKVKETVRSALRLRVLLADDHQMVADGIRMLLQPSCEVVGVVADGRALLEEAPKLVPDVIVLDITMPFMNGLDAAERLKSVLPNTKFVFLTMNNDADLAWAALKLGSIGYVLKHSAVSELQQAISEVLQDRPYLPVNLQPEDWAVRHVPSSRLSKDLTPRQQEVLQLLAEGRHIKEVAGILQVSEKTVMFHKYQIMQSHNLHNNADLVLFALRRHLISA
jgi:DNA-binding NarL/FixJ family response regulator